MEGAVVVDAPDIREVDDGGAEAAARPASQACGARVPAPRSPGELPRTAQVSLRLATPEGIRVCLRELGLMWDVTSYSDDELLATRGHGDPGLYTWVCGPPADDLANPVLYIGKGAGRRGMQGRLKNETSWIGETFYHGHGMAMHRLGGRALGGPVTHDDQVAVNWLDDCEHPRLAAAKNWLADRVPDDPLDAAERLAIRISMHLGDVVAPVNSGHASAWLCREPWETLAWLVVTQFEDWPRPGVPRVSHRV